MNHKIISDLAKITAINARIQGMGTENARRISEGYSEAYGSDEFFCAERELFEISESIEPFDNSEINKLINRMKCGVLIRMVIFGALVGFILREISKC